MINTAKIAILGAGQIGRAVYKIITDLKSDGLDKRNPYFYVDAFVIDINTNNISKLIYGSHYTMNLAECSVEELASLLEFKKVTHVINALPFTLNEKVASAAVLAQCSYIDFTEDDTMADKVQAMFEGKELNCAVKCGLAPGFINYIGYDLIERLETVDSLMVSVGALPRTVSYDTQHPENSYNLTWSVDGLVNEYIRPCRVRKDGNETEINPLSSIIKVILDGTEYEAACTSGGVGSLVRDLVNVSDVQYMTLRYPGHYAYIKKIIEQTEGDFVKIRDIFSKTFPSTDDDVIVVYATAQGKDKNDVLIRRSYTNKFYGVNGLSGIQSTTAGSGVAMLELMLSGSVSGIINHSTVELSEFTDTEAFKRYFSVIRE